MLNDPDLRNVTDVTTGDYVSFELFDAGTWRAFRISGSALRTLSAAEVLPPMGAFERHIERIKGVAFAADKVENGYTTLTSENFK